MKPCNVMVSEEGVRLFDFGLGQAQEGVLQGLSQLSREHLTARANYTVFTEYHKTFWSDDIDFIENPDLLHTNYKYSVRSGVYFWLKNDLFLKADGGFARENVDAVTRIINRDTDSYNDRWNNFKRIYEIEKNIWWYLI